jgi:importin-9
MEDQLIQLLSSTQLPDQAPRQQAELDLKRAQSNPAFPQSLANIAAHTSVETNIRQSALSNLRLFIEKNWAVDRFEDEPQVPIGDDVRASLKQTLLDLAVSPEEDRKVKISSR